MSKPLQIATDFVVLTNQLRAEVVPVTDDLYSRLDDEYGNFAGHSLVSSHRFDSNWPTWEMHPAGDEIVILQSGAADMVFALTDDEETVPLTSPGQFIIVPRGTWHTARVQVPTQMLFITPGEGTENREQLPVGIGRK